MDVGEAEGVREECRDAGREDGKKGVCYMLETRCPGKRRRLLEESVGGLCSTASGKMWVEDLRGTVCLITETTF
jgi:hypothetical protein